MHVLTNPQLWIIHRLPLSGLTCLQPAIVTSLAVSWDFSSFSSDCSDRVPKHQRDGEGIEASICTIFVRFLFLSPWILSHKSQWWRCAKLNHEPHTKFHENPTVNEIRIVVLLRPFWVSAGKEKVTVRRVFLLDLTWFCNSQC